MVRACARLLAAGGKLRVVIPSEGHWPWSLAWRIGTGLEFGLRYGLDYGVLMRHEHLNTADEIASELRAVFDSVEERWFGLSRTLSLYRVSIAAARHELSSASSSGRRRVPTPVHRSDAAARAP
jgi:hypothetical protein